MRLIVFGGRDFNDYDLVKRKLDFLLCDVKEYIEIVSGRCSDNKSGVHTFTTKDGIEVYGADGLGERYAEENSLPVKPFPALWDKYKGKSAAYIRNKQMAQYGTFAYGFWDKKSVGTKMMIDLCNKHDLGLIVEKY